MEFLNKLCQTCHQPMNGGTYRASHVCPHCHFAHEGGKSKRRHTQVVSTAPAFDAVAEQAVAEQIVAEQVVAEQVVAEPVVAEQVEAERVQVEEVAYEEVKAPALQRQPAAVSLTTKAAAEHTIVESLEEVASECVLNLKVTPEMISDGKFIGTKSEKVRAALEQGKKHVLAQLRQKAQEQGANIVTDVAVKNAVKTADAQNVKIVVRATGLAAVVEAAETSEA